MKKYLIKGALALFAGALVLSCAEKESEYVPVAQQKAKAFEDVFKEVYGDNIDPYQKWGFSDRMIIANGDSVEFEDLDDVVAGSRYRTRAGTRTSPKPDTPTFSNYDASKKPAKPSFATTLDAAKAAGAVYANDVTSWSDGLKVYIDKDYNWTDGNKSNLIIYVNGDVKYYSGVSNNGDGATFVVLQNSTLHLSSFGDNLKIYLAPGAVLDLTKSYDWQGNENTNFDGNVSIYKSNAFVYLSGTSRVTGTNITFKDGCKVLNNGGTISATNLNVENSAVLWNEGTVKTSGNLQLGNESAYVYNATGKSITVSGDINLTNNNNIFYNDGKITCSGNVTLQNTNAEFINENSATLTVTGNYSTAAGGKTYNEGTVTITGNTNLSNSNSKGWVNDGNWTCGSFTVDNYSHSNFNNCFLTVNGKFYLNCGTFVNNAGALVTCNSFEWVNTSDFYLGGKSKLDVKGTLTTNNYDSGYGFRGFGDQYAIIAANKITHNGNEQFRMSYYGYLFIDTNDHFELWYKDAPNTNQPSYWYESTVKFKFKGDRAPFTYVKKSCGGYSPKPGNGSDSEESVKDEDVWSQVTSQTGRVFCEDLGQATREDLDYNDVVFDLIIWKYKKWTKTTTTTTTWKTTDGVEVPGTRETSESTTITNLDSTYYAQITLMAAGGTLPLTVAGVEVHDAFGVGVTTMVNTVNDYSTVYGSCKTLKPVAIGNVTKSVKYNGKTESLKLFTGYQNAIDIPIVVNYNGKSINELSANSGKAPHKLFVKPGTKWAIERKNLALAYPDFVNYVTDANKNWTTSSSKNEYYMYNEGDTRGLSVMPTVIKNRRTYVAGKAKNLWTGSQSYGSSWSLNNVSTTFDVDVLYPGDRLRFYAKGIGEEAWINVSINNTKPYLLDSNFPNYVLDASGRKTMLGANGEGYIEVVLDETTAALLNKLIAQGYPFVVQGRNFILTRIAVVEFD
jgi:hypothetical protein